MAEPVAQRSCAFPHVGADEDEVVVVVVVDAACFAFTVAAAGCGEARQPRWLKDKRMCEFV